MIPSSVHPLRMPEILARDFLDLEATVAPEDEDDEEEWYETEDDLGYLMGKDESMSEDESDIVPLPPMSLPHEEAQELEDEARRFAQRATQATYATTTDDSTLPFRVPRENDPSIWSVRVKLGREADIVFQICRRCLACSGTRPLAVTSTFARSSIPGYVFIEAYNIAEVRRAVDGFVTVYDKQPVFIPPVDYVGLISWRSHSSPRIEDGQWVSCLAGKYRDDIGYVCESNFPMNEWCAVVAFIPRIAQPGGKRKRGGRPAPRAWTTEELLEQYGEKRVKVLGPGQLSFKGCLYQDGLAFELIPLTLLRVIEHSPRDIAPFVLSARIRALPAFAASIKHFAQDSIQVDDRIQIESGEHTGIIGRIRDIRANVADVVTQIPEQHSGLIVCVSLRDLIPYFVAGDHVKIHWLDQFGMVIAVDHDTRKVTFLDKKTNTEIQTSAFSLQSHSSLRFFHLTPGLYVEFPGAGGATRRGVVMQVSDGRARIMDEMSAQPIDINQDDITISGVQAAAKPKSEHNPVWEGRRILITKGALKGYRGLVKAEDHSGVRVELDAKLASHGPATQRVNLGDFQPEPIAVVASSDRPNRTPPPEDLPRPISPEPDEPEESASYRSAPQGPVRKHWLFTEEVQERLREGSIPFHVRDVPPSSPHAKFEGLSARTVPVARQKIDPQPDEVVVSVSRKGKSTHISINPMYLVPWAPCEDNKVIVVSGHSIGQVGKVIGVGKEMCIVSLEPSGTLPFEIQDVVNIL